jgi:hypothetical protein
MMATTLFLIMTFIVTPSAEWCNEKFSPQQWLRVIIELSGKHEVASFSSLFKQPPTINK